MKECKTKYFWMPSSDGTVIYVKKIWHSRFFGERIKQVAWFRVEDQGGWNYQAAVRTAEALIERLSHE